MSTLKNAELRAEEIGANEMPDREVIDTICKPLMTYIDIDEEVKAYWQNDIATVVGMLALDLTQEEIEKITEHLQKTLHPDELHTTRQEGRIIIRMWWD